MVSEEQARLTEALAIIRELLSKPDDTRALQRASDFVSGQLAMKLILKEKR